MTAMTVSYCVWLFLQLRSVLMKIGDLVFLGDANSLEIKESVAVDFNGYLPQ